MPTADLPTQIVFGIVIVVVVLIAGYFIARRLKGRVSLVLDKSDYALGETIVGRAEVMGRRPMDYEQIVLTLCCQRRTRYRKAKGKTETRTTTLYETSKRIAEAGQLLPHRILPLNFEIQLPQRLDRRDGLSVDLSDHLPEGVADVLEHVVLGQRGSELLWSLAVEVEAPGINIGTSERIAVYGPT